MSVWLVKLGSTWASKPEREKQVVSLEPSLDDQFTLVIFEHFARITEQRKRIQLFNENIISRDIVL